MRSIRPGTDECWVEGFDFVCCHDDFDVAAVVEAIQLIEELEHGALDLAFTTAGRLVAFRADGVDFVDENDGWGILSGDLKQLANEAWAVTKILLDQLGAYDAEKGGRSLVSNGFGEEGFAGSGGAVEDDTFGGFDAHLFVELRV